ncbi:hypothetical protein OCU04_001732 [Sclerotinia nivalis]|uniref:Alcohol dehydrogenase n=1 Tax=Sclerotinia nivalis TaxID=352851 RepID=A0A9X0AYQ8_9HELO|nr:hypothetical protein OCU04_001732 [Sclerotinia nivalis]
MGHEGIGWVRRVGSKVKSAQEGDCVSLTFSTCSTCRLCTRGHPASCENFSALNIGRSFGFKSNSDTSEPIGGFYFGQSSFASWSNVKDSCVVNISSLLSESEDFSALAPLGCGFQTGAGTVTKLGAATPDDSIAVIGTRGVGLSAIMVRAVDRISSRLELAKSLGATHTINTNEVDFATEVKSITEGVGSTITIDTTGSVPLVQTAVDITAKMGKIILVGVPPLTAEVSFHFFSFLGLCKTIVASIEGDVYPRQFIPEMIKWYKNGKFPIDRMVKTYKVDDFAQAISDMDSGKTVKPVLLW